jgi:hypothetical protein
MMLHAKHRANAAQQQDREEREFLIGGGGHKEPAPIPTPPSSGNGGGGGFLNLRSSSSRRKTGSAVVAKAHPDDIERVSLLGGGGGGDGGGGGPLRPPKNAFRIASAKRRARQAVLNPPWTLSRMMKYLSLMLVSCSATFWLLHKENKVVHWDEYHKILEPDGTKEKRCFVSDNIIFGSTIHDETSRYGPLESDLYFFYALNVVGTISRHWRHSLYLPRSQQTAGKHHVRIVEQSSSKYGPYCRARTVRLGCCFLWG